MELVRLCLLITVAIQELNGVLCKPCQCCSCFEAHNRDTDSADRNDYTIELRMWITFPGTASMDDFVQTLSTYVNIDKVKESVSDSGTDKGNAPSNSCYFKEENYSDLLGDDDTSLKSKVAIERNLEFTDREELEKSNSPESSAEGVNVDSVFSGDVLENKPNLMENEIDENNDIDQETGYGVEDSKLNVINGHAVHFKQFVEGNHFSEGITNDFEGLIDLNNDVKIDDYGNNEIPNSVLGDYPTSNEEKDREGILETDFSFVYPTSPSKDKLPENIVSVDSDVEENIDIARSGDFLQNIQHDSDITEDLNVEDAVVTAKIIIEESIDLQTDLHDPHVFLDSVTNDVINKEINENIDSFKDPDMEDITTTEIDKSINSQIVSISDINYIPAEIADSQTISDSIVSGDFKYEDNDSYTPLDSRIEETVITIEIMEHDDSPSDPDNIISESLIMKDIVTTNHNEIEPEKNTQLFIDTSSKKYNNFAESIENNDFNDVQNEFANVDAIIPISHSDLEDEVIRINTDFQEVLSNDEITEEVVEKSFIGEIQNDPVDYEVNKQSSVLHSLINGDVQTILDQFLIDNHSEIDSGDSVALSVDEIDRKRIDLSSDPSDIYIENSEVDSADNVIGLSEIDITSDNLDSNVNSDDSIEEQIIFDFVDSDLEKLPEFLPPEQNDMATVSTQLNDLSRLSGTTVPGSNTLLESIQYERVNYETASNFLEENSDESIESDAKSNKLGVELSSETKILDDSTESLEAEASNMESFKVSNTSIKQSVIEDYDSNSAVNSALRYGTSPYEGSQRENVSEVEFLSRPVSSSPSSMSIHGNENDSVVGYVRRIPSEKFTSNSDYSHDYNNDNNTGVIVDKDTVGEQSFKRFENKSESKKIQTTTKIGSLLSKSGRVFRLRD